MKKISLILPNLFGGGVERIRLVLAKEFVKNNFKVEFALMEARGDFLDQATREFFVYDLNSKKARNIFLKIIKYLRKSQPDAIIVSMWPLTVIVPVAAFCAGFKGKIIISEHCLLSHQYASWGVIHRVILRLSMMIGYRFADHRIAVSASVADDLVNLSWINRKEFQVIHNPLIKHEIPSKDKLEMVNNLWGIERGKRFINVASLKSEKNHKLLIEAVSRLPFNDYKLMIVGKGPEEKALKELVKKLKIEDKIIFAGFHHDLGHFYSSADIFIMSSDYEGFGNVILEAMSFGLQIISTNCSGPPEILDNGKFGKLIPMNDIDSLIGAIVETLKYPIEKKTIISRALAFDPKDIAKKYLRLIK